MVHGLCGQQQMPSVLPRLYPTPVSQYDPNPQPETPEPKQEATQRPATARTSAKRGEIA